ncbi:lactonase family protein [Cupriavidus campinensis]|uniref:lactonase family protein n=1 Tax=Cupriavidus campinensis TaxID=151783 RepID=UPI0016568876|nr:beta-propeller fold lactonase family protein [Cupriavidus campinensis]
MDPPGDGRAFGGETPTSLLRDPLGRFIFLGSDVFNIRTVTLDVVGNMTPTSLIGTTFRPDTMVATPDGQFLIAGSSATPGFDVFAIAPDGSLTSGSHLALAVAPSALAMHPSNSYLYVADPINNRIMEYRVDGAGNVTPLPATLIATDGSPQHLSIDPSGRYLYATSPASGKISQYTIAADGTLVAMPQPAVAAGTLPGAPTIDPTGRFLYVPNATSLEIRQYVIGVTGALTPLTPATVSILAAPTLLYSVPR